MPLAQDITGHNEGSPRQLMHSPRFFGGQEFSKAPLPTQTRDSGAFRHESGALTLIKGPRRCLRLAISTRNPRSPQGESSTFERCCRSMTRIAVEVELSPLPLGYRLANAAATTTMTRHQLGTHRRIHQPPHDRWTASTHHIALFLFLPRTRIRTLEDPQNCQLMGLRQGIMSPTS